MTDRMDIDALLIGALYGELTPADEARLAAHLESHPADRTALADLTRTRATVRDSRIFARQWDPPQAVSALLLQEAARRLPKRDRSESWFYRLARSSDRSSAVKSCPAMLACSSPAARRAKPALAARIAPSGPTSAISIPAALSTRPKRPVTYLPIACSGSWRTTGAKRQTR